MEGFVIQASSGRSRQAISTECPSSTKACESCKSAVLVPPKAGFNDRINWSIRIRLRAAGLSSTHSAMGMEPAQAPLAPEYHPASRVFNKLNGFPGTVRDSGASAGLNLVSGCRDGGSPLRKRANSSPQFGISMRTSYAELALKRRIYCAIDWHQNPLGPRKRTGIDALSHF